MKKTVPQQHSPLHSKITSSALLVIGLFLTSPSARADSDDRHGNDRDGERRALGIFPPDSRPYGKTYSEWSGAWWRWAYSIPASVNPVADRTGIHAAEGQSGKVWFLAGTFGGLANRTVTIPEGKALFFPIANEIWVNTPQFGDNPWSPEQEIFARGLIATILDNITTLTCEIDGQVVRHLSSYRFHTAVGEDYMVTFPEDSVSLPAGTYGPSVDEGYYLMLAPLSVGHHKIHFTAAATDGSFSLDVTYHLTIKEDHGKGHH